MKVEEDVRRLDEAKKMVHIPSIFKGLQNLLNHTTQSSVPRHPEQNKSRDDEFSFLLFKTNQINIDNIFLAKKLIPNM